MIGLTQREKDEISSILKQFPNVEKGILFGSRAVGTFQPGSDVDIALKGRGITLQIVARVKALLEEETSLPYIFDVVDYQAIENPTFREHIDRHGKIIYEI